ncbi:hypothetical protein GCM10009592_28740 [Brachybacterium rhamnosum]|uniref:Peptidoglycan DD-metalloendopeptidase family protein n=1 Tax=Brachybacterium rhamnosum TaxID=173361 RepID=A0ABW4Q3A3_9MICO
MAAAPSNQIATAALGLVPVISGIKGNITAQLAGSSVMSSADSAGKSIGSRMANSAMSALKGGLKVGGVIGAAVGAITAKGGLDRALGIEDARAQMSGLGHDTKSVDKIMGNALKSVEGTAFGLDAAATTAAGAVAAGIKPGEQLEQTLTTVANVAAGAKAPMEDIGGIFNTVAAVGTAYTGDINMIAQRGIPIWQSLGDQLGKTQDEVKKMATKGDIDFATFQAAAQDAAGGVAKAMGDTTRGSFANMMASVRKLGAMFVTGILPLAKTTFTGIQSLLNAVKAKVEPFVNGFFEAYGDGAQKGIEGFFQGLVTWVERFDPTPVVNFFKEVKGGIIAFGAAWTQNTGDVTSSGFPGFMEKAAYWIRQVWDQIKTLDFSSFSAFGDSISAAITSLTGGSGASTALAGIGSGLAAIAQASPDLLAYALKILGGAMGFVADHMGIIAPLLPLIVAGVLAWNAATKTQSILFSVTLPQRIASNTALAIANGLELANTIATNRSTAARAANAVATNTAATATTRASIATRLGTIATNAAALAQRAFGAALRFAMGPIGWIITGITLLVGGLIWFFTQTEVGQQLWSKIWGWIKDAAAAVVTWFTDTALPFLKAAWDGIAAGALWLYQNAILPAWNGIQAAIGAVATWVSGTLVPALRAAWNGIATAAMWLWTNVIQPVWTGIKTAIAIAVTAVLVYIDLMKWYFSNVIAPVALWLYNSVIVPVWNGIKTAIGAVVDWIGNVAWPAIKVAWDAIAAAAQWLYNTVILPVWNSIKGAIASVVTWIQTIGWPALQLTIKWIGDAFSWVYNNVIKPVWSGIQTAIRVVVDWFKAVAWPIINAVIGYLKNSFEGWKIVGKAVWDGIKAAVSAVASWFRDTAWPIVSNVIEKLKSGFNTMRDVIKTAWDFIKDKAINPVATWFRDTIKPLFDKVTGGVKDAFTGMKDTVEKMMNGVRDTAKAPVKFLVETIIRDGIIGKYNEVANGVFGLDKVDTGKFTVGWSSGGYTGPGSKYTPAGIVHADEYVIRKESQNDLRRRAPGFLDSLNQYGAAALGYASGGLVKLRMPFAGSYRQGEGFGARGGAHKGIDWPIPSGTVLKAVAAGVASRSTNSKAGNKLELSIGDGLVAGYHHLSGYIAKNGQSVGRGADVGYVGSTGRSSGPHLHFSLRKDGTYVDPAPYLGAGGAAGSGGGGWWNPFDGLWDSLKEKVREGVGDSAFGNALFEVPQKVIGGAVTWATEKLSALGDFASETAVTVAGAARWTPVATEALTREGQFGPNRLSALLRRMKQESGFDPRAINNWDSNAKRGTPSKGLMQVIQPTFDAYRDRSLSSDIYDPLANIVASIRYTLSRYGDLEKGWNRKGGYANGGWTGPGSKFDPAGIVHADEYVIRRESQRSISRVAPGLLDSLNARGASALGLGGYASGGLVSPTSKIGSTRVSVIVDGLTGTTKQVTAAAGKLADAITAEFKKKLGNSKTSTVNALADQLAGLKKQAQDLQKVAKGTTKVVQNVGRTKAGKPITKTVKVSTAEAKKAAEQLKSVQKQIQSTSATLKKARRGDMTAAAASASAAFFTKNAQSTTQKLTELATTREKLTAKLKDANKALTDAIKVRDDYGSSLIDKFAGGYVLSDADATMSIGSIIENFQTATSKVKTFAGQIGQLSKRGLAQGLIDQIAQLGADTGSNVAANLLSATPDQLKQLSSQYGALNSASSKAGTSIASSMYQSGVDAAQGMVKGLNSEIESVKTASETLAETVVTTVRKKLDIRSPSRVLFKDGAYGGQGLGDGFLSKVDYVQSAMASLVDPSAVAAPLGDLSSLANRTVRSPVASARAGYRGAAVTENHYHYEPTQVDLDAQVERRTRREFETMVDAAKRVRL